MNEKLNIALVEDNRFHALLFEQATRGRYPQARIAVFISGRSFLDSLSHTGFDLIAVDYSLPDMNGLELISLIHAESPDTPIVVMTGNGSEQIAVEAMKSGATDYISKSGDYDEIIPRVLQQAYRKQRLILKNRRLAAKAREMEKLETITALVSTLNHEINNPLMAIQGNVELLLENPTISEQGGVEKLKMIEQSARRIRDITHQMANLMTTSIRQTPVGPMFNIGREKPEAGRKSKTPPVLADKTD